MLRWWARLLARWFYVMPYIPYWLYPPMLPYYPQQLYQQTGSKQEIPSYPPPYSITVPIPYPPPPPPFPQTPEEELAFLEEYKRLLEEDLRDLQEELRSIEERIRELKQMLGKKE